MSRVKAKVEGGHGKIRTGRGFSKKEIAEAGVSVKDLKSKGLIFDARRGTTYEENVAKLKELFS